VIRETVPPIAENPAPKKTLGILGGMGPAATADFLAKLTAQTPAKFDQEHIRSVVCCFSDIPDRTDAILARGPSPVPAMLRSLALLEQCGVANIAIPCNTAHYWFEAMQRNTIVPIIHIVDAVREALIDQGALGRPVGLLATTATIRAGVYANRLASHGIDCLCPLDDDQAMVMDAIRQIKAGANNRKLESGLHVVMQRLRRRGAGSIVLGCTELPLVYPKDAPGVLDSTAALARECIRQHIRES
jgi:aspartate racemase